MTIVIYPYYVAWLVLVTSLWGLFFLLYGKHFIRKKKVITGCESRGDLLTPYLTRYTLLELPKLQICLHIFHRSDADDLHDHPWNFVTIPLWRGYTEQVFCWQCGSTGWYGEGDSWGNYEQHKCPICDGIGRTEHQVYPLIPYFRKATHQHRVILLNGKPAVTLVFMGPYIRHWGFWVKGRWVYWKHYFESNGC